MFEKRYLRHIAGSICIILAISVALHHYLSHRPKIKEIEQVPPVEEAVVEEPSETVVEEVIKLKKGETLITALTNVGIDKLQAQGVAEALKKVFKPKDLRPDHELYLTIRQYRDKPEFRDLEELNFEATIDSSITVTKTDGVFKAQKEAKKLILSIRRVSGQIESGLYVDASKRNVPSKILHEMTQNLLYEIDFQRAFHPGDTYGLIYETDVNPDSLKEQPRSLLFAIVELQDKTVSFYRFKPEKGDSGYYNAKGESIKRGLLRTPIDGAKISSRYGMRRHPILGYTRAHKGVDFSAPSGTPIMASGSGVVDKSGHSRGYGNCVRIKHNHEYSTFYAHLSRFAKGMKAGKRVKQGEVIGYVGSTGLASGPHLHYELLRFNTQINPSKVSMLPAAKLSGKDMERFKAFKAKIDQQYKTVRQAEAPKPAKG
ncbi:M23 family metallopeptidase [Candidatus Nucleicultrix amoebiphila]|jgi:murein DD-endopeptidase MepM/ murein hydrolase activator NlpD|uniref:M23 family metallopeptidase n=1 Tax=Candidatus Nucleicultrix amoebiphila TaxID=1509244 RepID=UPI000A26B786|nr:M23 family metallopeptidase [Candidatus Nucleicultrix amoebiphila]